MKKILFASVLVALGSSSALAADMAPHMQMKTAPVVTPVVTPVSAWQGFYIGGNVGYGWGNGKASNSPITDVGLVFDPFTLNTDASGAIGGAQIGYNWQIGSVVAGVEADIQGSGIKGSNSSPGITNAGISSISFDERISWFGTVRGRLGVTVTPTFLLYATGGLAYGHVKDSANVHFNTPLDFPASVSRTKTGWTAGVGGEWMFASNWSAKVEYLYIDLGNQSATVPVAPAFIGPPINYNWKNQENIVRAGVNYHF